MPYHSDTQLERIDFRSTGWRQIMGRNMVRLNDTLLYVSGMLDVDLTSLSDRDILQYNAGTSKFENVSYDSIFPSTTTTSTTTTTSSSTTTTAPLGWSDYDKSADIVISNNNLTAAYSGSDSRIGVRANKAYNSGKYYFEWHLDAYTTVNKYFSIGWANADHALTLSIGAQAGQVGAGNNTVGRFYQDGGFVTGQGGYSEGDYGMVAVDLDTGYIWFGLNGTWYDDGDPVHNLNPDMIETELTGGDMYPALTIDGSSTHQATLRTHKTDFEGSLPAGFSDLAESATGTTTSTTTTTTTV